jgi:hypothetical protein
LEPGEEVTVVEESRLREAEAERDLMERANETSMKLADDLAGDVERLEAERLEAQEIVRPFAATWGRMVDDDNLFHPPTDQSLYRKAWHWLDRARSVLEKGDKG